MSAPSLSDPLPSERVHSGVFTDAEARQARRLTWVVLIIAAFFGLELTGAILSRSNVLKADAIHLLMDVFALTMSLLAMRLAVRRPTPRFTFGLRRAEPVAAILNAFLVLAATSEIVRDGIDELRGGETPVAGIMLVVSIGALFVNGLSAWLLHGVIGHHGHAHGHDHDHAHGHGHGHAHGHSHAPGHVHRVQHQPHGAHEPPTHGHAGSHEAHEHAHDETKAHGTPSARPSVAPRAGAGHELNLKGARLHLLGDTLGSLAALVAALVIHFGGPVSIDAIASFVVAVILVVGALKLLRDATLVLLEAAPPHLPVHAVRQVMEAFPKVTEVHDMHVWTLGAGHDAIIVHVRVREPDPQLATALAKELRDTFGVEYVTVQVELVDQKCDSPPSRVEGSS